MVNFTLYNILYKFVINVVVGLLNLKCVAVAVAEVLGRQCQSSRMFWKAV